MYFVLKLSKLCNLRCTYCYEYEHLGSNERMPLEGLDFFLHQAGPYLRNHFRRPVHFVLHGGEPSLLPPSYLRSLISLQRKHLRDQGVNYKTSMQTNLLRYSDAWVDLLEELEIGLGVSIDVFGGERVNMRGEDSQHRIFQNLQRLIDYGGVERLNLGGISVLHRNNYRRAVATYCFYRELGLPYRILPIFSLHDVPARMQHLTLGHSQTLDAFKAVTEAMLVSKQTIPVEPLSSYLRWAVNSLAGSGDATYDPAIHEWALIVDTNGDVYNNGEAYLPDGLAGNIFRDDLATIMSPARRSRSMALRKDRNRTCERCLYSLNCSRVPLIEAVPSERDFDASGSLICPMAKPMIDYMVNVLGRFPEVRTMIDLERRKVPWTSVRGASAGRSINPQEAVAQ